MPQASAVQVHDLFVPGTRIWNESLVRKSFMAIEAEEVLKIKPGTQMETDVLAWAFEKHGRYSVRSAYRLLKQDQMEKAMEKDREASGSGAYTAWPALWKLDVPPKIRVFWWRVLHKSLPSKAELKRRHVAGESHCEMCGEDEESLFHVFFACPLARRFWGEVKKLMGITVPRLHPGSWELDVLQPGVCSVATARVVICGAWALWTGRNGRRHGRKTWEPGATARYISTLLEDLESLKQPARSKPPVPRARWEKPDQGWVKVNSDASYDQDMCSSSAGAVIRDHAGIVKGGVARWFDDVGDVLTGEALAAKEGLELAAELGFDRVILEVDCQELSKLLQSPYSCTSSIGGLCFDIIELGKSFSEFSVRWVRREANSVAHFCASIVSATDRCSFWFDCIPDWLEDLAISDCTLASN